MIPADAAETAEALIAGQARKTDAGDEAAEPFAQVQALPEWSDSPDVIEALKEFEQGPNPLFAADGGTQTIEPTAQPESDEVAATADEAPAAPAPPPAPSDGRDDAVAALGMEIFGGDMLASTERTDAAAPPAPQAPHFCRSAFGAAEFTFFAAGSQPASHNDNYHH